MLATAHKAAGARLCRAFALALFALPAWAVEYWATQAGAGLQNGTSLENAWPQGSIVYGGANAAGRGDTLYLCGTEAAPITATIAPSGIGAFDGTANADADIFIISGDSTKCGGTQGYLDPTTSHAINASGLPGVYIQDLTCHDALGSCFQQLLSSTSSCAVSGAYYCGLQRNLTCTRSGLSSGHCATIVASGNTNFPASAIPALLQENVTSYDGGGAACNIRMHAIGATQRNCKSYRDGSVSNVWGVYQAGVTLNTGAANSGAGVTWANVSGTVYKTTQTTFGASTGATINDVYSSVTAAGVAGDLAFESGCVTNDATCAAALGAGEWGQIGDVLYINRGASAPTATAAVYVTYAWNTNPVQTQAYASEFDDAFDGVGVGLDFGTTGGVIERADSHDNPGYNIACGAGAINCTVRSSVVARAGTAAIRMGGGGGTVENVSSAGNATVVSGRTHTGETLTVRNVAAPGGADIAADDLGDGTLTEATNSNAAQFVGGANPATADGFRLSASSPGAASGENCADADYFGDAFYSTCDIGAFRRDSCYRRSRDGKLDMARTRAQVVSRCLGIPGRYPEGL